MTVRAKGPLIALLVLMTGIAGCTSTPERDDAAITTHRFDPATDPYWLDPIWAKALLDAAEAVVHDPVALTDTTTAGPHVTIKFTFANGMIRDPAIIAGTGDPNLDDLLLKQVIMAQVPKPSGLHADESHGFLLDLDMLTPYESFQDSVFNTLEYQKVYPKNAILYGRMGVTKVDFDYLDGKASAITLVTSSKDRELDESSLNAVNKAAMPAAPSTYAGKTLHMEVLFCYTINGINKCPDARNIIFVLGTRFISHGGDYVPVPSPDH